jgi:ABC-type multidrug transport system fused ATPase/permease subunit
METEKKEKSKVKFFTVLKYFWPFMKRYKWYIFLTFLATFTGSVAVSVFSPLVYKKIIDLLTNAPTPGMSSEIIKYFKFFVLIGVVNFVAQRTIGLAGNYSQSK